MSCKEERAVPNPKRETVENASKENGECWIPDADNVMAALDAPECQWASAACPQHHHEECLLKAFGQVDLETAKFLVEALENAIEYEDAWEPLLEPFLKDTQAAIKLLSSDPATVLQKAKNALDNPSFLLSSSESTLGSALNDSLLSLPQQSAAEAAPFERFRNPRRTIMDGAQNRAVSLRQLRLVVAYLGEHADADGYLPWTDWNPQSKLTYGKKLHMDTVNMYHLVEWVVKPVTQEHGCSLVEILSDSKQQSPKWFVSHVWSEPIKDFLMSIEEHARIRGLSDDDCWWVCSFANNQHFLDDDINIDPDPRKTSFYRALKQCEGVLLCLDKDANPFVRAWCCFESAMIVNDGDRLKLDISTVKDGKGVVLTDGLVDSDFAVGSRYAYELKRERESSFPLELLERGYSIDVREAKASYKADIRRILNAIIGVPANELDLREPDKKHPSFDTTNQALRGIYAECAARKAAEAGRLEPLLEVLRQDEKRTMLTLNLGGCHQLDLTPLKCLAGHPNLQRIFLDCAYCFIPEMDWIEAAFAQLPRLHELDFNFSFCGVLDMAAFGGLARADSLGRLRLDMSYSGVSDVAGIGIALAGLSSLQELHLDFRWCSKLRDIGALSDGLASLKTLKDLDMSFKHCDLAIDLPGLEELNNLQNLSIDFSNTQTATRALRFLRKMQQLRHLKLTLEGCKHLAHLAPFGVIGSYPLLESLSLSFAYTNIGGGGALENLRFAPNLQRANLSFAKCARLKTAKWSLKTTSRMQSFTVDLSECSGLPIEQRGVFMDRDELTSAISASSGAGGACDETVVIQSLFTGEIKCIDQNGQSETVEVHRLNGGNHTSASSNSKSKEREKRRNYAKAEARSF